MDFERLVRNMNKEKYQSIKTFGLNNDQCYTLINIYLSRTKARKRAKETKEDVDFFGGDKDIFIYSHAALHACVNPPPCSSKEKSAQLYGKKWCKGRGLKIGTKEFESEAEKIVKQIEIEKEKNIHKMSLSDRKKAENRLLEVSDDVSDLERRINALTEDIIEVKEEDIEKRISLLSEESERSEEEEERDEEEYFIEETKKIQTRKDQLGLSLEMAEMTLDVVENIEPIIKSEVKEENKFLLIQEQQQKFNSQILKMLEDQKQELKQLNKQQEYINRAARRTLGEEYWMEQFHRLTQGGLKTIAKEALLSPFKVLNTIVLKPAKYAFWKIIGKWAYLLWGLLMLFMLMCVAITTYKKLSELSKCREFEYVWEEPICTLPSWMESLINMITYLSSYLTSQGSIIGKYVMDMVGETIINLAADTWTGISNIFINVMETIKLYIYSILNSLVEMAIEKANPFKGIFG
jgi:hypothetical protein